MTSRPFDPVDAAGNVRGFAASRRSAPPSLRYGPSGDTANPRTWRLVMTGRGLPVITDRLDTGCRWNAASIQR